MISPVESLDGIGVPQWLAIAAALGWASGLRLYAAVFLTGLAGRLGWVELPGGLGVLQHAPILWASGILLAIEFLADKLPFLDSLWDLLHTLVRIPAGAALAAAAFPGDPGAGTALAALMGGTLAATAHVAKTVTRAAVNTSPEPASNIALSLAGDAAVPSMLWLSWTHPVAFFATLALVLCVSAALVVGLVRAARRMAERLHRRWRPRST